MRSACSAFLFSALAGVAADASDRFVNDISLPSKLWMLSDAQNDVFVRPLLKRWRPDDDYVRFSVSTGRLMRHLGHVASLDKPIDGAVLNVELVNGDAFETVKRLTAVVRVGEKGVGGAPVCAQILGDSYTAGRFYEDALVKSGSVPDLRLVGLRNGGAGQFNEGRGGWTLGTYFHPPREEVLAYHGFMHPDGGRYWGARAFWRMAWRCFRKTQPKGFEPAYSCSDFDACLDRFDETTGTLRNPVAGDLQYDGAARAMLRWNGSAWEKADEAALKWSFDYGKYLDMWRLEKPQFLFVLLGLNDFRNDLSADFGNWGRRIGIVKDSYQKACPKGRFVICIPCSACGSIDNAAGDFTPKQNAAMWRFRDWLIRTFDNREKDGFYLLDTGVAVDNEHGYFSAEDAATVPFAKYKGSEKLKVQRGNPHPYFCYPGMGLPLAAFIQYYRDREGK